MQGLIEELRWRGLVHDVTPGLHERLERGAISGYVGFDPTATSLQIGNLVPIMLLAHLQRAGGKPIALMGGGTGLIGDPSGKDIERPLLDEATVRENSERQARQFEHFLQFGDGSHDARMIDNAAWLTKLELVEFLRDIGKHFTLSYMLQKESVRSRLESGISFTEFSYMLLQAYDFLKLFRTEDCEFQLGGTDQWGNITAGIELIRRVEGAEAHGLSAPLLTSASGKKFGKTEGGTVWLDPALTSVYKFYQFWINADDRDVESYLKVFTFKSAEDIRDLMEQHAVARGRRIPHTALAHDVTARVHDAEASARAAQASQIVFGELDAREAAPGTWRLLANELPTHRMDAGVNPSTPVVDLLLASGIVKSKADARRQLQQGGITINGTRVTDVGATAADLGQALEGEYYWIRRGKKTHAIIELVRT